VNRGCLGVLLILLIPGSGAAQEERAAPTLWYRQPAANWNEALPIGNGRLGAMVFGGVGTERLQLNEDTIWTGEKRDRVNPDGAAAVPRIRQLLFDGKAAEAEALADKTMIATPRRMPPYQPLGDLTLAFDREGAASAYRRELNLDEAIARVSFQDGPTTFTREVFASAPDQAIVLRLAKNGPGKIGFRATLSRERDAVSHPGGRDRLVMEGQALPDPRAERQAGERRTGVRFAAALQAIATGGRVSVEDDGLTVKDADAVTLLLTAATDVRTANPVEAAIQALDAASAKP